MKVNREKEIIIGGKLFRETMQEEGKENNMQEKCNEG